MFLELFEIFKKDPQEKLKEDYSLLHDIIDRIYVRLKDISELQKNLLDNKKFNKNNSATGQLAFEKSKFIREELIPKLEKILDNFEKRFFIDSKNSNDFYINEEKILRKKFLPFFLQIESYLISLDDSCNSKLSESEKFNLIDISFRNITELCHKFYLKEEEGKKLLIAEKEKEIIEQNYLSVVSKIYDNSRHLKNSSILIYEISQKELKLLEVASKIIKKSDAKIIWRNWWDDEQIPEIDYGTDLKDPHINMTLVTKKGKKDIHLLLKSA